MSKIASIWVFQYRGLSFIIILETEGGWDGLACVAGQVISKWGNIFMNSSLSLNGIAYYSIQLRGILDQDWADPFGDLRVFTTFIQESERAPVTTIVGGVADQAALSGFLNLVYSLGLPLLSVTYLGRP